MLAFVVRRFRQSVVTLLITTLVIRFAVFVLPGDPIRALFGLRRPSLERLMQLRDVYDLNDPFVVQYAKYLWDLLRFDFGELYTGGYVSDVIKAAGPVTVRLVLGALFFQVVLGITAGVIAFNRKGSWVDKALFTNIVFVVALPVFVLARLGQQVFAQHFGWLPAFGTDAGWRSYVLPALVLSAIPTAYTARLTRSELSERFGSSFVRSAFARGFTRERVVWVHALRGVLVPVVALIGAQTGTLLAGSVLVEQVFRLGGLGGAVYEGVRTREGPLVVGVITLFVLVAIVITLIVDIVSAILDPRIRTEREPSPAASR